MDVEAFVALVDLQRDRLIECSELDGATRDGLQSGRLALRADRRRHEAFVNQWLPTEPPPGAHELSKCPVGYRWPSSRVEVALKVLPFEETFKEAAAKAIAECESYNDLNEVVGPVLKMAAMHHEWLTSFQSGHVHGIDERWASMRREIGQLLNARSLLVFDEKREAWERWKRCFTSVDQVEILDVFWLADSPLSNEDLNARLSFQRDQHSQKDSQAMKVFINRVNKAGKKAGVGWTIEWDKFEKARRKKWLGDEG